VECEHWRTIRYAYLQVADLSKVNGLFKTKIGETKREYNELKGTQSLSMSDIVPIVNTTFDQSFCNAANTRHAISECGWVPALKYCLLNDKRLSGRPKELEQSTVSTRTSTDSTLTDTKWNGICHVQKCTIGFNNTEDFAAAITKKIVDDWLQQEGQIKAAEEWVRRMQDCDKHVEIIKNLPKMTSGQLMANGWLQMDKKVLENQRKRNNRRKSGKNKTTNKANYTKRCWRNARQQKKNLP
jgi:hypothetical protein